MSSNDVTEQDDFCPMHGERVAHAKVAGGEPGCTCPSTSPANSNDVMPEDVQELVTRLRVRARRLAARREVEGYKPDREDTIAEIEAAVAALEAAYSQKGAARDREVAAKAWDDGAHVYIEGGKCSFARDGDPCPYNPYREGGRS